MEKKEEKAALPWPGLRVAGKSWCLLVRACEVRTAKQRVCGVRMRSAPEQRLDGWGAGRMQARSLWPWRLIIVGSARHLLRRNVIDERFWELNGELTEIVVVYSIELECNWRW